MNIRDLQYLVAVYELQSFSKAAERCFVSQPTLSGQIKKLEDSLGSALIERSTRKILFTPIGEKVVEQARSILNTVDKIKVLSKQNIDPMAGDFHIGLIPTVGPYLLPKIMPALNSNYPQANLYLYEQQTEVLIERLLQGELDAAILAKLDWHKPLKEWPLYKEPLRLAVNNADPLATHKAAIEQEVLKGREILMLEDGHCLRDQALGVCFAEGAKEDKRYQATSMNTLLHMVASGTGSTLVPELACSNEFKGVTLLPFKDAEPSREIIMISRVGSAREPSIKAISKLISSLFN